MNNFTAASIIKNQISRSILRGKTVDDQSSTIYIGETLKNDKIKEPLQKYKSQIAPL